MNKDVECPYCGVGLDIDHEDGYGYDEGVKHQQYCQNCEKTFVYETSTHFYYECTIANCLNGESCEWEPTFTYPVVATRMECNHCGQERKPTDMEMKEIVKVRSNPVVNAPPKGEGDKSESAGGDENCPKCSCCCPECNHHLRKILEKDENHMEYEILYCDECGYERNIEGDGVTYRLKEGSHED